MGLPIAEQSSPNGNDKRKADPKKDEAAAAEETDGAEIWSCIAEGDLQAVQVRMRDSYRPLFIKKFYANNQLHGRNSWRPREDRAP